MTNHSLNGSTRKRIQELTPEDYDLHPIWTYFDDEGDEVVPVDYPSWQTESIGGEAVWMKANLLLHDGSQCIGFLSFNIYIKKVTYLDFVDANGKSVFLRTTNSRSNADDLAKIAALLDKPINAIFPMIYTTPFTYLDGTKISGIYPTEAEMQI